MKNIEYCVESLQFKGYWDLLHYYFNEEQANPSTLISINVRNNILINVIHKNRNYRKKSIVLDVQFLKCSINHPLDNSIFGIGVFGDMYNKFYFIDSETYNYMVEQKRHFIQFGYINRVEKDSIDFIKNGKIDSINLFNIYFDQLQITSNKIKPITILSLDRNGHEQFEQMNFQDFQKIILSKTSNGSKTTM